MYRGGFLTGLCFIYAFLPYAHSIDCYRCSSLDAAHKECEDEFRSDTTTEHLITKDCFYGYWRAHYCVKLKGVREDGSSILVRQCSMHDWGSHCGEIQFDPGTNKIEMIDGCLETCNYDGCNLATINSGNVLVFCLAVILAVIGSTVWR